MTTWLQTHSNSVFHSLASWLLHPNNNSLNDRECISFYRVPTTTRTDWYTLLLQTPSWLPDGDRLYTKQSSYCIFRCLMLLFSMSSKIYPQSFACADYFSLAHKLEGESIRIVWAKMWWSVSQCVVRRPCPASGLQCEEVRSHTGVSPRIVNWTPSLLKGERSRTAREKACLAAF